MKTNKVTITIESNHDISKKLAKVIYENALQIYMYDLTLDVSIQREYEDGTFSQAVTLV